MTVTRDPGAVTVTIFAMRTSSPGPNGGYWYAYDVTDGVAGPFGKVRTSFTDRSGQ